MEDAITRYLDAVRQVTEAHEKVCQTEQLVAEARQALEDWLAAIHPTRHPKPDRRGVEDTLMDCLESPEWPEPKAIRELFEAFHTSFATAEELFKKIPEQYRHGLVAPDDLPIFKDQGSKR